VSNESDSKRPINDMMNELYKEYGLTKDHIFIHPHYKIITRAGIDLIQSKADIDVKYEVIVAETAKNTFSEMKRRKGSEVEVVVSRPGDLNCVVVKAIGKMGNKTIETFGEAYPSNNENNYFFAMAEKRGMSRVVLKLAGLYEKGFFGEEEADDFKDFVKEERKRRKSEEELSDKATITRDKIEIS